MINVSNLKNFSVSKAKDVVWRRIDDKVIILNLSTSHYYTLELVGIRIWELCEERRNLEEIAELIAREFSAPIKRVKRDLIDLVLDIKNEGLIEIVG